MKTTQETKQQKSPEMQDKSSSGKTTETEAAEKRQVLVGEILRRAKNPSFDIAAAEKSYDLAMRIAEATLEKSVWDTSGGDYLSQAIYFSKWRAKEGGKGAG